MFAHAVYSLEEALFFQVLVAHLILTNMPACHAVLACEALQQCRIFVLRSSASL